MRAKNSSSNRRTRVRRQNSAEAKKGTKYTLIDLVDNINTDVKSDVADFDFQRSNKEQVVAYFEKKVAQIREEHRQQIQELKEETSKTILELQYRLTTKALELQSFHKYKKNDKSSPVSLQEIQQEIKNAQRSIQVEQSQNLNLLKQTQQANSKIAYLERLVELYQANIFKQRIRE